MATGLKCPKCGKMTLYPNGPNRPGGPQRWRCGGGTGNGAYCYGTTDPTKPVRDHRGSTVKLQKQQLKHHALPDRPRYIVTQAQNATPVHEAGLETLKIAARKLDAEIVVIPTRYKNATSQWSASQANAEWWDPLLKPYLFRQRKKLNDNLVLIGDVPVQPTATRPLTGFEGFTHGESCILGHSKIQLKVVPVAAGKHPKILTTTGSITVKNYTESKAGALGAFHHSLGAVLIEIQDSKKFHLRQLVLASDGSFTDLDKSYDTSGVRSAAPALGLVMGDTHFRWLAPGVRKATFDKGGMIDVLRPNTLVWHDSNDNYSCNHHHEGNPFIEAAKRDIGYDDVLREVSDTIAFIDVQTGNRNSIIVPDNHGDFMARWIIDTDWRELSGRTNKDFYLETARAILADTKIGIGGTEYPSAFAYWVMRLSNNPGVRALKRDEPFALGRFACGMHGHEGPNGSRGSILNLSRLGSLVISGHGHTPGWEEGHRRVGTSAERQEYEHGPTSHMHTHCVVYASGASCLLNVIGDSWRI
jgi:hypothetical protein